MLARCTSSLDLHMLIVPFWYLFGTLLVPKVATGIISIWKLHLLVLSIFTFISWFCQYSPSFAGSVNIHLEASFAGSVFTFISWFCQYSPSFAGSVNIHPEASFAGSVNIHLHLLILSIFTFIC